MWAILTPSGLVVHRRGSQASCIWTLRVTGPWKTLRSERVTGRDLALMIWTTPAPSVQTHSQNMYISSRSKKRKWELKTESEFNLHPEFKIYYLLTGFRWYFPFVIYQYKMCYSTVDNIHKNVLLEQCKVWVNSYENIQAGCISCS